NTAAETFSAGLNIYTMIGNHFQSTGYIRDAVDPQPPSENLILAYNHLTTVTTAIALLFYTNYPIQQGAAVVQNVFERRQAGNENTLGIAADSSRHHVNNLLLWHNTIIGQRYNGAYNDAEDVPLSRVCWSVKNNTFDDYNIKSDVFGSPSFGFGTHRIGNWPVLYGADCSGNAKVHITGCGANGFDDDFPGLSTLVLHQQSHDYYHYQANHSTSGDGSGNGDYHPTAASPVLTLAREFLLPFDLGGTPRHALGASGAFEYGSVTPKLTIIAPNGGELWRRGETRAITWTPNGTTGNLVIELLQNNAVAGLIASGVSASTGSYSWTVGRLANGTSITGTNLKIRISTAAGAMLAEVKIGRTP
ncbi:MAG: hypothetical protein Q8O00_09000, partial [Holophaga sp.]|nr:hypothetical protein [Holophaga sp.]